ncbi:transmembrane and ubiquitin-like domain-containing protein 1 [Acanthaster planci]|uniref:Transmembrane and ubiquitin-like domain-containing protein 1 n=1 Tax=Acanthaster planci TaxID=133434 RepID=A0A8B7Y750_ACAPL|nr:transmembrane and ubiquitin-like domain-containing protein 1 [Acanthaster planci]XP_022088386.1 transmembrane and ubiquitin-like domain-containing protein 1 [Acanthaster planci]XP_022088387.1 transmembrane and ubiquitin-like domain-containing protein 1 [Acanthaster planci]
MPFIEGIGDEVTVLASVLILATTLLVAWLSTSVSDRPGLRTVLGSRFSSAREEEHSREAEARIEEVDVLSNQRTDGTENTRLERDSSPTTDTVEDASQSSRQPAESTETEALSSEFRTGLEEIDSERTKQSSLSQEDATVTETSPASVVRNRLTGETCTYPTSSENTDSRRIPTSTTSPAQKDGNQSGDATQTITDEGAQSDPLLEQSPRNRPDADQSGEQSQIDGQGQAAEGTICIRIKYLTDQERVVYGDPAETLGRFRQRAFSEEISSGQTVRLIFNGQLLQDDDSTLAALNLSQNCVIHCLLSQSTMLSSARLDVQDGDVDLGRYMIPLFTCILGFVWYLRWQYRYMFNATSTLSLVGVTTLFVLAVLASWRG